MKIYPLGVGGAFTKTNYHNNYMIKLGGKLLLIDAGTTLRNSLFDAGFNYTDPDFVFISHLHFDHVGGLEEMIMQRFWQFNNGEHSPVKTIIIVHEKLVHSLKALLRNGLENQGRTVEDFCELICLKDREQFNIDGYEFSLFNTSDAHVEGLLSFGFKLAWEHNNLVFSGDIKLLEKAQILKYVNEQTVAIFQDISFTPNGVHATIQEVLHYYPTNIHEKIYGMHYNDHIEQFNDILSATAIKLVRKQEILEF